MRNTISIVLLAVLVFFVSFSDASVVYDKAVAFYKAGKYDSTVNLIRVFLKTSGKDPEAEKLVPLLTEAQIRTGDFSSVDRLFSMFRQRFPASSFLPRMWYCKGMAEAKQKHYSDAVQAFSTAFDGGVNSTLESQIVSNAELVCQELSYDELSKLIVAKKQSKVQEVVRYYEIVKLSSAGQPSKTLSQVNEFQGLFPRSKYDSLIRDIADKSREQEKSLIQIGMLAPLSGDASDIGKKVVHGAQLAFELHAAQSGQLIKPIILDTKGSMMETARRTKELIEVHKVPVILGPVLSQNAIVSAAMVMGKNTVMLTPTATEEGIAALGNNIFQMNVSTGILARKVASYAVENLNMKEFAILAPQSEYGTTMANSFKDELKKRNVDIIAEVYFEEGANDFSTVFQQLRAKLLRRYLERVATEKGVEFKGRVTHADSLKYADTTLTVGGLFIPAEAEDVVMIAPQVAFNRIKTQILGSNGWQSPKVIHDGSTYVQGAVISSTVEPDQNSKEWVDFKKSFKARFNDEPDRISALGYDAANLIINAFKTGGNENASQIAEELSKVHGFAGLSGFVSFDKMNGTNSEAAIMKITSGGFVRVQ